LYVQAATASDTTANLATMEAEATADLAIWPLAAKASEAMAAEATADEATRGAKAASEGDCILQITLF
jgi:hypothetical protein